MNSKKEVQHVYLVGAKSLGAYGGYETFVYKLTEYHQNKENIKYHVACKANGDGCMDESKFDGVTKINEHEFELHNAHCFKIDVPQIGPAQAIYYDVAALKACCEHIRKNQIPHPIVYIMACRIGPFAGHFYKEIHKLGGTVYLNPDGHEWMRAKWSAPIRKYWKISEQMMVKYCNYQDIEEHRRLAGEADEVLNEGEASIHRAIANYLRSIYKDTNSIISLSESFWEKLSDIDAVVVVGWAAGKADWPYLRKIQKSIKDDTKWHVYYYDNKALAALSKAMQEEGIEGKYEVTYMQTREFWD